MAQQLQGLAIAFSKLCSVYQKRLLTIWLKWLPNCCAFTTCKYFLIVVSTLKNTVFLSGNRIYGQTLLCEVDALPLSPQQMPIWHLWKIPEPAYRCSPFLISTSVTILQSVICNCDKHTQTDGPTDMVVLEIMNLRVPPRAIFLVATYVLLGLLNCCLIS